MNDKNSYTLTAPDDLFKAAFSVVESIERDSARMVLITGYLAYVKQDMPVFRHNMAEARDLLVRITS